MGPVGLYCEGATMGFQTEERQRHVPLGKRRVWDPSSSGAWEYGTHGTEEHGVVRKVPDSCQQKPQGTIFLPDVNLKVTPIPGLLSGAI